MKDKENNNNKSTLKFWKLSHGKFAYPFSSFNTVKSVSIHTYIHDWSLQPFSQDY